MCACSDATPFSQDDNYRDGFVQIAGLQPESRMVVNLFCLGSGGWRLDLKPMDMVRLTKAQEQDGRENGG